MIIFLILIQIYFSLSYHPIKATTVYLETNGSNKLVNLIKNYVEPKLKTFYFNTMQVFEDSIIDDTENFCYVDDTLNSIKYNFDTNALNNDLILAIHIKSLTGEFSNFLAFAYSCNFKSNTKRPDIVSIVINSQHEDTFLTEPFSFFTTLLHESFHGIGFIPSSFDKYIKVNGDFTYNRVSFAEYFSKDNNGNIFAKSPNLLNYVKSYVNCSNLVLVPFENGGTSASKGGHFEMEKFLYDFMVPQSMKGQVISFYTINFIADMGYYAISNDYIQNPLFGADKGCNLFTSTCNTEYPEFGILNDKKCSINALYTTNCIKDDNFIEQCYTCYNTKKTSKIGERCLAYKSSNNLNYESQFVKSYCKDNGTVAVFETIKGEPIECKSNNQIITLDNNNYYCPFDISVFCDFRYECKNDCSEHGTCYNGNCVCDPGYIGSACEYTKDNYAKITKDNLNTNCNENSYYDLSSKKCVCYENYEGNNCENIINNAGSFGSNCSKNRKYIKCYKKLDDAFLISYSHNFIYPILLFYIMIN